MTMLTFGEVAPIKRRAFAYLIDAAIGFAISAIVPMIIMMLVATASGSLLAALVVAGPLFGILGLAWFVVYTVMQGGRGSIGMRAMGVCLADATTGGRLGFGRALLRNVIWGLAASIVVGYFSVLFDGSGLFQGWHDKVGGAVMLDGRPESARNMPPLLDTTQPPLVPSGIRSRSAAPGVAAPGFPGADSQTPPQPPAPQTSMPGFAQPRSGVPVPAAPVPTQSAEAEPALAAPEVASAAAPDAVAPADEEFAEHTVLTPRIGRDVPEGGGLPDDPLISFVPGVTQEPSGRQPEPVQPQPVQPQPVQLQPVQSIPAPGAPAAAGPEPSLVHRGEDETEDEDIESTRISVPGHRLVFTWDDGQRSTVSGRTVFGRNPEEGDGAVNVAVRDETRSLSKTHFEAGADARGGWVMDRQSTNGTTVVREGVRIACPPGQRVPVRLGDALEIGDRIVTIGGYV
ncbi:RDD family protein [Microbacterium suwonense]|uniref:FHA domain-containing protein n=1 Tax=Microbacterium suwonense TaxID=683047 RepID=A0ABM8FVQ9_9MICO|nr:RDD family protein [Microbacterium suwonense]BDZ39605.1 hypothetical protein GCM10025863_22190 [Microbacterium suwonense]